MSSRPVLETLRARAEFQRCARGLRRHAALFTVQAQSTPEGRSKIPRIGYTVTRKIGTATERNRIKRRLRAAVAQLAGEAALPALDLVILAKRQVIAASYTALLNDLRRSVAGLDKQMAARASKSERTSTNGTDQDAADRDARRDAIGRQ